MNWTKLISRPYGFDGAEAVIRCETHMLALWNHDRCCGWQLYKFRSPRNQVKTKWLVGAGVESVHWSDEQAIAWAETQINQQQ